jgi:LPXTG cell wall anchor motif
MSVGRLVRRLCAQGFLVAMAFVALTGAVFAQSYDSELPPGVEAVSIAGSTLNANEVPVIETSTPTFSGRLTPGPTEAEFVVMSTPQRWTVPVDPVTGEFETTVPEPLEAGTHSLYINDALVGQFVIALNADDQDDSVTQLPSTGTGVNTSNALGTSAASLAVLALIAFGGSAGIRRRACR